MKPLFEARTWQADTALITALMVALITGLITTQSAQAFAVFPYMDGGQTLYLKWGDNRAGIPAPTVTWSLIPAGTAGDPPFCDTACPGVSSSNLMFEISPGGGFEARSLSSLVPLIEAALARWSAVTGIRFQRIANDSGAAINDPGAVPPATGHIRIGIFSFSAGGGAVGYAPPPNGGTGAGDVLFDAGSFYQIAPGNEGEPYDPQFAPNDFPSLLLHELGHAMGLAHPPFDGSCPVMQVDPACFGLINRELDPDDINGASFLYGYLFIDGLETR